MARSRVSPAAAGEAESSPSYGLTEQQFRNIFAEASRRQGVTGENMLRFLELRLDNVIYRAGWAATRPQARQFVGHGHVNVNGRRVDIPSYRLRKGDVVELRPAAQGFTVVQWNLDVLDRTPRRARSQRAVPGHRARTAHP